jgi:hypothetical protein
MMEDEKVEVVDELNDLFKDTGAHTATFVSFKPEPEVGPSAEPTSDVTYGKTPKKRSRASKPRARKPRKKPYVDSLNDFIVNDSYDPLQPPMLPDPTPLPLPQPTGLDHLLKSKRENLKHSTFITLKEQGKNDVDIRAELKKIEHMSEDDLDFEIQKISFTQSQHFTESIAGLVRDGAGWIADAGFGGQGKIRQNFEQDKALKNCLQKQMLSYVGMLGLGSQIALLTATNIFKGKTSSAAGPKPTTTTAANESITVTKGNLQDGGGSEKR